MKGMVAPSATRAVVFSTPGRGSFSSRAITPPTSMGGMGGTGWAGGEAFRTMGSGLRHPGAGFKFGRWSLGGAGQDLDAAVGLVPERGGVQAELRQQAGRGGAGGLLGGLVVLPGRLEELQRGQAGGEQQDVVGGL